jgi:TetR/AcrR family transcriptional repressor of nem operon
MARHRDFDEQEALEKAMLLFWQKGYNAASPQDILDTLGLSRSSLYRTFTNKHTLFLKALDLYQKFSIGEIKKVIDTAAPAKETIRKLLEFITEVVLTDEQHKGCFMLNSEVEVSLHDEEVHQMVVNNDREMEDIFYQLIKTAQHTEEISKLKDPAAIAGFLLNTAKGIRVTAKSNYDKKAFQQIIAMAMTTLD